MLSFLFECAARSVALGIVAWLALKLFRVRSPQTQSLVWTSVLLSALAMPVLVRGTKMILEGAPPAAVAWIPTTTPGLLLRPLPLLSSTKAVSPLDWVTVCATA